MEELKQAIRNIPDFPKPGIQFKDITPILSNQYLFKKSIQAFSNEYKDKGITSIVGVESRGFIIGAALANEMNLPFVPIRKKGKLPYKTIQKEYQLEYGTDIIEIHEDALKPSDNILLIDDLLATGGTISAAEDLIIKTKAKIAGIAFLIELEFLKGRERIHTKSIFSLIKLE